jgi:hypothetical protein
MTRSAACVADVSENSYERVGWIAGGPARTALLRAVASP